MDKKHFIKVKSRYRYNHPVYFNIKDDIVYSVITVVGTKEKLFEVFGRPFDREWVRGHMIPIKNINGFYMDNVSSLTCETIHLKLRHIGFKDFKIKTGKFLHTRHYERENAEYIQFKDVSDCAYFALLFNEFIDTTETKTLILDNLK